MFFTYHTVCIKFILLCTRILGCTNLFLKLTLDITKFIIKSKKKGLLAYLRWSFKIDTIYKGKLLKIITSFLWRFELEVNRILLY